jgi:hypothetical protein
MLKIRNVTLEGPDLSGKSTLYSNIHKSTKFKWNIQDRSQLSMLCYARQFERGDAEVERWRRELKSFLLDLNNRLIVLLPVFQVIAQRLSERGDEVQDIRSLRTLHSIFEEEVTRLGNPPNLLVIRDEISTDELTRTCVNWLARVALQVQQLASSMKDQEAAGCRFQVNIDTMNRVSPDDSVLRHLPEEVYYAKILSGVLQNIDDELKGKNEYGVKQDPYTSRRFIFTQDSCISLIHTMLRGDALNMKVYCRSSDVKNTFPHDFGFICYLYSRVYAHLASRMGWNSDLSNARGNFTIDVELGSAHIP